MAQRRKRKLEELSHADACAWRSRKACCKKLCVREFTVHQVSRLRRTLLQYADRHSFLDARMKVQSAVRRRFVEFNDRNRIRRGSSDDSASDTVSVVDLDESDDDEKVRSRPRVHTRTEFYVDSDSSLGT